MEYKSLLTGLYNVIKTVVAVSITLAALYSGMWTLGIAPMTNSQAEDMIEKRVSKKAADLKDLMIEQGIAYDEQLFEQKQVVDDIDENVDLIQQQNAVIEERTKRTADMVNRLVDRILGQ